MATRRIVIIGGGLAAATAAQTLREEGFDGDLTVVGAERHLPYLRPPLSKEYLKDPQAEPLSTYVHPFEWYPERGIHVITGTLAVELDLEDHEVTLDDRSILHFDRALIATGSAPRPLQVPGADADGVHYLRTLDDSAALRAVLAEGGHRVAIIGSGWIGMEVAAVAREYGNNVTVIARGEVPLASAIGTEIGAFYAQLHRDHGVEFRLRREVVSLTVADEHVTGVVTDREGELIPADLVVVGLGATPRTELAEDARLPIDNGILVDEFLRTGHPDVFAAGDVANAVHPLIGRRLRSEHWANAIDGGAAAARNLLDQQTPYAKVPYFYSDQYDVGMEYAGFATLAADVRAVYRGDPASREFIAFWVSGGRLVAGMNVNVWDVNEEIQRLVAAGAPVDVARLVDPSVPLGEL